MSHLSRTDEFNVLPAVDDLVFPLSLTSPILFLLVNRLPSALFDLLIFILATSRSISYFRWDIAEGRVARLLKIMTRDSIIYFIMFAVPL
jgi:hypothetical protein